VLLFSPLNSNRDVRFDGSLEVMIKATRIKSAAAPQKNMSYNRISHDTFDCTNRQQQATLSQEAVTAPSRARSVIGHTTAIRIRHASSDAGRQGWPRLAKYLTLDAPSLRQKDSFLFSSFECTGFKYTSEDSSEVTFLLVENYQLTTPVGLRIGREFLNKTSMKTFLSCHYQTFIMLSCLPAG
jgi:hypothetical protein